MPRSVSKAIYGNRDNNAHLALRVQVSNPIMPLAIRDPELPSDRGGISVISGGSIFGPKGTFLPFAAFDSLSVVSLLHGRICNKTESV